MNPSLHVTSPLLRKPILTSLLGVFLCPGLRKMITKLRFNSKLGQHTFTVSVHCRHVPELGIITVPTLISSAFYGERGLDCDRFSQTKH